MSVTTNDKMTGITTSTGGGGGTTFAYDVTLQAATATVDGQEVLAPKRSGSGIQAQVVARTGTLADLMSIGGNAGETARPTDYSGFVCYTGNVGEAYYVGQDPYVIDVTNPATLPNVIIPRGFTSVVIGPQGGVPNAAIRNGGGITLEQQLGTSGIPGYGRNFVIKVIADFTGASGSYAYLQAFFSLLDLSIAGGSLNYFEVFNFASGTSTLTGVITSKSVNYSA